MTTSVKIAPGLVATRNDDGTYRIDCEDKTAFNLLASTMAVAHANEAIDSLKGATNDTMADALNKARFHNKLGDRWLDARRLSID